MTQNNFTGSISSNFATAGNWSLGHVPNDTEDAEIDPNTPGTVVESNTELVNSIGTAPDDGLVIDNGADLFAFNGTGPNANDGGISLVNATLFLNNGTFNNLGNLYLEGVTGTLPATLAITGAMTLDGGGSLAMAIGAGPADNFILGDNTSTTPSLDNVNDTISGDGTIEGLNFTNEAAGLIQTNNTTSNNAGIMQIIGGGTSQSGSFTNKGTMLVNSGGEFLFGQSHNSQFILNYGTIVFQADNQFTTLAVTGNLTIGIQQTGSGIISMDGQTPNDNRITSAGQPAMLSLEFQTVDGAGTIGDSNLTLDIDGGAIEADLPNGTIVLNTGTNRIDSEGMLTAQSGGTLVVESPLQSSGQIDAVGGTIFLEGPVLLASPGATVDIGQNGILVTSTTISGSVTFAGTGAELAVRNTLANGGIGGQVVGAVATDKIDVASVGFTSDVHAVWLQTTSSAGTLSLYKNGLDAVSFNLTGQFNPLDFVVNNDGSGGSLITVQGTPSFTENPGNNDEWIMTNGQWDASAGPGSHPAGYNVAGIGDWTGNGTDGILWYDPSNGDADEWQLSNTQWSASVDLGTHPGNYQISGVGDFNGDGISDVLWTSASGGSVQTDIWELSSSGKWAASISPGAHPAGYSVAGVGDWTGSGTDGILWYNATNGDADEWQLSGGNWAASVDLGTHPANTTDGAGYQIAGAGDFFDNGRDDVLWTSVNSDGTIAADIWELGANGQWAASVSPGNHPAGYQVAGIGDFTGTGTSDILWYNPSTGDTDEWLIKNGGWAGSIDLGTHPGGFQIAGVGDFNGDGTKDILWHSPS